MKAFVIVILSIWIFSAVANFFKSFDEDDGSGTLVSFIMIIATILALIFACNLH